jgi:hypothetical protein
MLVQSRAEGVLPRHRPAMPPLAALRASPHRPILVTPDPGVAGPRYGGRFDPAAEVPINGKPFDVESDIFKVGRRRRAGARGPFARACGACGGSSALAAARSDGRTLLAWGRQHVRMGGGFVGGLTAAPVKGAPQVKG